MFIAFQKTSFDQKTDFNSSQMVQTEKKNTMFHWKKVIYSDESRIEIRGSRILFVRRPKGSNYRYNHKYLTSKVPGKQKSIMIFGAIGSNGLRILEKVNGNMNDDQYIDILRQKVLPCIEDDHLFQQDNTSCHNSSSFILF